MEQHRDFPEASVASRLGTKLTMPFRARPHEAGMRAIVQTVAQNHHRLQQRHCDRCGPKIEQTQHPRGIATEAMISFEHMIERIVRHGGGQPGCHCNKGFEAIPTRTARDDGFQRLAVILCIDQGTANFGEGFQGVAHRVRFIRDLRLANALRSTVEPADDPVMGLDHGVGEHRLPF